MGWFNKIEARSVRRDGSERTPRRPQTELRAIRKSGKGDTAAHGFLWLLSQTASGRIALFLGQIVLARLLSPEDFGTIGLTYTITTIIGYLTTSGIGDVLVQRSRHFYIWAWPGFLIDIALASIGGGLVLALAPLGARLYATPEISGLAQVMAVAMPLGALSTIPLTALRVSLNFRLLAAIGTVEIVAAQILSVLLAWYGMGAYSFVVPMPVVAVIKAVWLWVFIRPRLPRTRPRRAWFNLVRRGCWIWGFRLLIGLVSQGDYFVLGLLSSRQEVGFYFFAFRLSAQPLQALALNLSSVMFPVLVNSRSRPEEQSQVALKASQVFAVAIFFVACLQTAIVAPILHLLFYDRWNGSILLSQILSIGLSFDAVCWVAGALVNARGEFRLNFVVMLFAAPCFFGLVGLGALLGQALGVAIGVAIYYAVLGPCYVYIAIRDTSTISVLRLYVLPLTLAGLAVGGSYETTHFLFDKNLVAPQIVSVVVLASTFYAGLLRLCIPGAFFAFKTQAAWVLSKLRR